MSCSLTLELDKSHSPGHGTSALQDLHFTFYLLPLPNATAWWWQMLVCINLICPSAVQCCYMVSVQQTQSSNHVGHWFHKPSSLPIHYHVTSWLGLNEIILGSEVFANLFSGQTQIIDSFCKFQRESWTYTSYVHCTYRTLLNCVCHFPLTTFL